MILKNVFILIISIALISCDEVTDNQLDKENNLQGEWLIPQNEIFDGGPGKDGIPAITNPNFVDANSVTYLNDNDLVIAIKLNDEIRVYPHSILNWHEIINDGIENNKFAVTYCPLTGSGIAYNRVLNGEETTFGVSGLLYNTNLIPYDRLTNSNWSQMKMQSVNGILSGISAELFHLIEIKWKTIKDNYPDSKVVSNTTGYSRNYNVYPYGDYRTNDNLLLFPVSNNDSRIGKKERVLGILINGKAKAFRIPETAENYSLKESSFEGIDFTVISGGKDSFIAAYENKLNNNKIVTLNLVENNMPFVMEDQFGNKYDLFGTVVEGIDKGERLKTISQYVAYWFAWAAFYPETSLE